MSGRVELLVLKAGEDYLRVQDGRCRRCRLEKASVFPLSQLEAVRAHLADLRAGDCPEAQICRLKIAVEPFSCA